MSFNITSCWSPAYCPQVVFLSSIYDPTSLTSEDLCLTLISHNTGGYSIPPLYPVMPKPSEDLSLDLDAFQVNLPSPFLLGF